MSEFYSYKKQSKTKGEYIYYQPYCKECVKEKSTKWTKENPDKRKTSYDKYNASEIQKERSKVWNTKYRNKGGQRKWQRKNPDKIQNYQGDRLHKEHEITALEWEKCKEYFNYKCAYCGISDHKAREEYGNYLHKDHADHNGANDLSNCIPACKSCNSSKGAHNLVKWFESKTEIFSELRLNKIQKWLEIDYKKFMKSRNTLNKIEV